MKFREKWLGLLMIPFINSINYYLTYTTYTLLTYSIDTVQGWIVWYAGRALIQWMDQWHPYTKGVIRRILLQVILTNILMQFLIIFMTWSVNAIWGDGPLPVRFFTENLVIFFIWILVFNGIYIGIHFYRQLQVDNEPTERASRIRLRLGKQQFFLERSDILYFKSEAELVTSIDQYGKTYYLDLPLRILEKEHSDLFFRANRQYLLQRKAIRRFQSGKNGKLKVWISKGNDQEIAINVSRNKAPSFREWMEDR